MYFIVYEELSAVLIVAMSDKKAQQATINRIVADFAACHRRISEEVKKKMST